MRTIRLLVVEDSPSFQFLIREAFRARGDIRWDLIVANDGEEAVRLLFEEENENVPLPDLILLDWNLPKVSGSEVLQRVKQHENYEEFRSCLIGGRRGYPHRIRQSRQRVHHKAAKR